MKLPLTVVIDSDPGIDDAIALFLAAGSPEVKWLGVTCVAGNRPLDITAPNARALLDTAGRGDVPVHAGASRPIAHAQARCNLVHGEEGLGGVALHREREVEAEHAVDFLRRVLTGRDEGSVTLIAVGPLTNLALVELLEPGLLRRAAAVVVMGGAAFCPGNVTPSAEFNFYADPLAAHIVMNAGARVVMFGLDVTSKARMSAAWIASFRSLGTRCGDAASAMLESYAALDPLLHDACPVAWLLQPQLFTGIECEVAVDARDGPTEGHVIARAGGAAHVTVMTDVDCDGLLSLVYERIAALP